MNSKIARVVLAYKRRLIRKLKRRSPITRMKARQAYRKRKAVIRLQRRRYLKRNKVFLKSRKVFKRSKPHWLIKKKQRPPKPKYRKPKKPIVKKFHVAKRHPVYEAKRQHTPKMTKHLIRRKKHADEEIPSVQG
jgi:hypothetical protein